MSLGLFVQRVTLCMYSVVSTCTVHVDCEIFTLKIIRVKTFRVDQLKVM